MSQETNQPPAAAPHPYDKVMDMIHHLLMTQTPPDTAYLLVVFPIPNPDMIPFTSMSNIEQQNIPQVLAALLESIRQGPIKDVIPMVVPKGKAN